VVSLYRSPRRHLLAIFGPGAIVAELAMIDGLPRSGSVQAIRDCESPSSNVLPSSRCCISPRALNRYRNAARALLQFARQLGEEAGPGRIPIRHRAAQGYLAAMAGVARNSVSCTFREWHRQKVVQGSSRTGYVVHKAKLEGAAGILARAERETPRDTY
jgi:CRP/FNR family transcriptional regulator, cyclic AMP receptor protein